MNLLRSIIMICAFMIYAPAMMAAETGTVAETMESGGYVYIRLENGIWIAANHFAVAKGDEIQYSGAMEMNNFESKSLDRTFESILFVSEAGPVGSGGAAMPAMPVEGHGGMEKPPTAEAPTIGEIKPLADGKTVAAIFAESAQLKDQVVSLKARVIKINTSIMGRNWITLQDGTGTEPDNRVLATSQEEVAPGDLVVAKGTLNTDVDLGYGYEYKVLLEEATFSPAQE